MIRLTLVILIAASLIATALHVSVWVTLVPLAGLALYRYTAGGLKLRCPYCGKRIKLGYVTCHHCGRAVHEAPAAAPPPAKEPSEL